MKKAIKLLSLICALLLLCPTVFLACDDEEAPAEDSSQTVAMQLDGITVSKSMMSYYFRTNYIDILNQYMQYAGSSSDPYTLLGINTQKSLKEQTSFDGTSTWYDYLLTSTKSQVTSVLVYVAAAKEAGVELDEDDRKEIENHLDSIITNAASALNMSKEKDGEDAICASMYGDGVKKSDLRSALELQHLASKYSTLKGDGMLEAIKKDDARILETYNKNGKQFKYVDSLTFSFDVYYNGIVGEKYPNKTADTLTEEEKAIVLVAYREAIEEAKKKAAELAKVTSVAEYNAFVANYVANENYEYIYENALKDFKADLLPSEENVKIITEKVVKSVIAEINADNTEAKNDVTATDAPATEGAEATKKYSVYGIEITKEYSEKIKLFKDNLFANVLGAKKDADYGRIPYSEPDDDGVDKPTEWAFAEGRKELDTKVFEMGDGANGTELKPTELTFSAFTVMITKTPYRIETLSRDFAYLLFTEESKATAAVESLGKIEALDKDKFLALASAENSGVYTSQFIEDCAIGSMGSEALDEWLFDEATKEGSYTKKPLILDDGSYLLVFFEKQNSVPEWKNQVIKTLRSEDYSAFENEILEKFSSKVTENAQAMENLKDSAVIY